MSDRSVPLSHSRLGNTFSDAVTTKTRPSFNPTMERCRRPTVCSSLPLPARVRRSHCRSAALPPSIICMQIMILPRPCQHRVDVPSALRSHITFFVHVRQQETIDGCSSFSYQMLVRVKFIITYVFFPFGSRSYLTLPSLPPDKTNTYLPMRIVVAPRIDNHRHERKSLTEV